MNKLSDIGVELGNSKFTICVRDEGIVATEAAYLAYRGDKLDQSSVIAFGNAALQMYERSHAGITVVTPMSEGVVVDCRVAGMILNNMAQKAGLKKS